MLESQAYSVETKENDRFLDSTTLYNCIGYTGSNRRVIVNYERSCNNKFFSKCKIGNMCEQMLVGLQISQKFTASVNGHIGTSDARESTFEFDTCASNDGDENR
jgi:hypothetical protein